MEHLGGQPNQVMNLLKHKPLQLLLLDNLGGMEIGNRGYDMRRWLRGLDQCHIRLVAVSNERLEICPQRRPEPRFTLCRSGLITYRSPAFNSRHLPSACAAAADRNVLSNCPI